MCAFRGMLATIHENVPTGAPLYGYKRMRVTPTGLRSTMMNTRWVDGKLRDRTRPRTGGEGHGIYVYSSKLSAGSPFYDMVVCEVAMWGYVVEYHSRNRSRPEGFMAQRAEVHKVWCIASDYDKVRKALKNTDIEVMIHGRKGKLAA